VTAVRDAGDSAILLELEPVIDSSVNARAIAIAAAIKRQQSDGVRDVVPTYRSVAVHFDPLIADVDLLRDALRRAGDAPVPPVQGSLIEVPVAYGGENGPDLEDVATFAKLPANAVIDRHCAPEYRVFMLGFLPGFGYMGVVDASIAAPRKATPRMRIPAGSVGIAGRQTGIYPRESPGGWQLIGRTSLRVFDPTREPASLLAPGDRVKFVPSRDPGSGIRDPRGEPRTSGSVIPDPRSRSITVLKAGLFTTIQDAGRWGYQDRGVPVSGPMDRQAYRFANARVGNPPDTATLEATVLGPELRFERPAIVAIAGADLSASINDNAAALDTPHRVLAGSVLRFGERRSGARSYIAIDGGIDVPLVLGSRSTHVVSGLGGLGGRALQAGNRVPLGTSNHRWREPLRFAPQVTEVRRGARLRIMRGPQDYHFDDAVFDWLQRTRFTISSQSDRMGYRLSRANSDRIPTQSRIPPGSMISDATFIGGLQIPPSFDPILLMADRQTTGGYPQIATVITADLSVAGQLAPADWIEFEFCTRSEAIAALREQEEALGAL
jgi:KipI family sensor histidine kinase inhibitor